MCVQSKLVWEVSRYRNGGLAGGWWCGVTWSVRTCVGSVEGPELFETGASFDIDSFPSLARRNRPWRIIRENRLNKVTKLVKIDHTQSDLSICIIQYMHTWYITGLHTYEYTQYFIRELFNLNLVQYNNTGGLVLRGQIECDRF
jgi:hypothetical protein